MAPHKKYLALFFLGFLTPHNVAHAMEFCFSSLKDAALRTPLNKKFTDELCSMILEPNEQHKKIHAQNIKNLVNAKADIDTFITSFPYNLPVDHGLHDIVQNISCQKSHTPLSLAITTQRGNLAELLIGLGANVDKCAMGIAPLRMALENRLFFVTKKLLATGCNVAKAEGVDSGHKKLPLIYFTLQVDQAPLTVQLLMQGAASLDPTTALDSWVIEYVHRNVMPIYSSISKNYGACS